MSLALQETATQESGGPSGLGYTHLFFSISTESAVNTLKREQSITRQTGAGGKARRAQPRFGADRRAVNKDIRNAVSKSTDRKPQGSNEGAAINHF